MGCDKGAGGSGTRSFSDMTIARAWQRIGSLIIRVSVQEQHGSPVKVEEKDAALTSYFMSGVNLEYR